MSLGGGRGRRRRRQLATFDTGLVRGEDPGVSAGRRADVEVKLDVVL